MRIQKLSLWFRTLAVLVVLCGLLAPAGLARAQSTIADPTGNTLQGHVTLTGSGAPAGMAKVVAWQDEQHNTTPVNPDGAYSLGLSTGTWLVTVNPVPATTTSPDWVYTAGPQSVTFNGNPDPLTPIQTLDLSVTPATGLLTGHLAAPAGAGFAAPNRAWVRAESGDGLGNTVLVDPVSGAFSIHVLPGHTRLRLTLENPQWAPPETLAGSEWLVEDGLTQDVGSVDLLTRQAHLNGIVLDHTSTPVANMPIRAWRVDGAETARGLSLANGTFSLPAVPGLWQVQVLPPEDAPFLAAQDPVGAFLPEATSSAYRILRLAPVDVIVTGTLVDALGNPVNGLRGHVLVNFRREGRWPQFGAGTGIKDSQFTLKLSSRIATQYKLRASFPASAGYTAISDVLLTIDPALPTATVTLPVAPNNSSISGTFFDHASGLPKTGLPGAVFTASDSGALAKDKLNPLDGTYAIPVATTNTDGNGGTFWLVRGFVDPVSGYAVQPPRHPAAFIPWNSGDGADVTVDFTVTQLDATLTGLVTDWAGTPLKGARVIVREQNTPAGLTFHRWALTNGAGVYAVKVPAGKYEITADFRNWISPVPASLVVASLETKTANLQFRAKNASIRGSVSYDGAPHTAFIRAYSDTGAHVTTVTALDGSYVLPVNAPDTWHVQAVSEEGDQFLKSARATVRSVPGNNPGINLVLLPVDRLPEGITFSFPADVDQVISLSNGAKVNLPAGALAVAGEVTLIVQPLPDLADNGGAQPVSFGYRLLAFDAAHMPITHFNTPVTLVMPFTAEQLTTLGVTPEMLIPSYWDASTSTWQPVPSYSLMVNPDGSGEVNLNVDHFTDFVNMADVPDYQTFLPMILP